MLCQGFSHFRSARTCSHHWRWLSHWKMAYLAHQTTYCSVQISLHVVPKPTALCRYRFMWFPNLLFYADTALCNSQTHCLCKYCYPDQMQFWNLLLIRSRYCFLNTVLEPCLSFSRPCATSVVKFAWLCLNKLNNFVSRVSNSLINQKTDFLYLDQSTMYTLQIVIWVDRSTNKKSFIKTQRKIFH